MASYPDSPDGHQSIKDLFGPQQVDALIRQAITSCWISLPAEGRSVAEVEAQVRRIFDRAINNLKEDASQFGIE